MLTEAVPLPRKCSLMVQISSDIQEAVLSFYCLVCVATIRLIGVVQNEPVLFSNNLLC